MVQDISQPKALISDKVLTPDILVISRTFFPSEGGIEEYIYNRCQQDPERIILLTASREGDRNFDKTQPFPIYRWFNLIIPIPIRLVRGGIKQILSLVGSFVFGIYLYFRYGYRYIEFGHGYDFPAVLLLSYVLPIQFFIYLHGDDVLCPLRNSLLRSLFNLTLERAQGIVCNSAFTRDYLKEHFEFSTPTHIINPTVRPDKFKPSSSLNNNSVAQLNVREAHNIPETAILILSVGRLVQRKGFSRVIESLPFLLEKDQDVHYLICGRGPIEVNLKSLASRLDVAERVHFAGFVPDQDLAHYYTACDLFAMPTFFDTEAASIEGFGIVYAEAGYFGKPVVASRVGGVEDAVHHKENGILVDPNSTNEFTDALYQLCGDQELRKRLGLKGQELASRRTFHRIIYS